jgi:hypothetical protein
VLITALKVNLGKGQSLLWTFITTFEDEEQWRDQAAVLLPPL